jgi:acyl carrier protein
MSTVTPEEVRAAVLDALAEPLADIELSPDQVPDDFDLLMSGLIDSLGILELIVEVNERFEIDIDFEELDPEGLTVLGSFSRYVADRADASALETRAGRGAGGNQPD